MIRPVVNTANCNKKYIYANIEGKFIKRRTRLLTNDTCHATNKRYNSKCKTSSCQVINTRFTNEFNAHFYKTIY